MVICELAEYNDQNHIPFSFDVATAFDINFDVAIIDCFYNSMIGQLIINRSMISRSISHTLIDLAIINRWDNT